MDDDDLEELKHIFLDECLENMEMLEHGLMRMGDGDDDPDTLNEVFRAAHSIKGGGATFGFMPMSELTHHMETLLDAMRSGKRSVNENDVDLLFSALDIVKAIQDQGRSTSGADHPDRLDMQAKLEVRVNTPESAGGALPTDADDTGTANSGTDIAGMDQAANDGTETVDDEASGDAAAAALEPAAAPTAAVQAEPVTGTAWYLEFAPKPEFIQRGNDPLLILSEIARRGNLALVLDAEALPAWDAYDPSMSYLKWQGELRGEATREEILDIFAWVDTECTVTVDPIVPANDAIAAPAPDNTTSTTGSAGTTSDLAADPLAALSADGSNAPMATVAPPASSSSSSQSLSSVSSDSSSDGPVSGPAAAGKTAGAPAKAAAKAAGGSESSSIRIATDKIDQMIDLVGELVITQSMLSRVAKSFDTVDINELRERVTDLEHNTRDLQESVMQVRMLPLSSAFSRLPRLVRDLSKQLGKEVDLIMEGGTTELDKTVLERMIDPLVHIVRNSLDHGIETPADRRAAGKPPKGRLALIARQESGGVIIEIIDDGKGINSERVLQKAVERGIVGESDSLSEDQINQLVFAPSFSTAEKISDVSGRGVGMDVVRRNILDLGGRVHLYSTYGSGTRIEINLPLSLAILDGQLIRIGGQIFVIPILCIIETLEIEQTEVSMVPGIGEVCRFREDYLTLVRVSDHFNIPDSEGSLIVIVETHGERQGLVIDEVVGQQQVVIKPLDRNYAKVKGLAGATIMSDGSVSLILDPATISDESVLAKAA